MNDPKTVPSGNHAISPLALPSISPSAPLFEVSGLASGYGRIPILHAVDFSVRSGEHVGVLGHNGMGKTTLLKTLTGHLPTTSGQVRFNGRDITHLSPTARAKLGIGYVPQGREIFSSLTVMENLRVGCLLSTRAEKETIDDILTLFPRLKAYLDRAGGALSGGEQQLLALARCLCGGPSIVLLDEPTEGIQPSIIEEIIDTLKVVAAKSALTLLLVEQNLNFISSLSQRILILQKGTVTREVPPDVIRDPTLLDEFVGIE